MHSDMEMSEVVMGGGEQHHTCSCVDQLEEHFALVVLIHALQASLLQGVRWTAEYG